VGIAVVAATGVGGVMRAVVVGVGTGGAGGEARGGSAEGWRLEAQAGAWNRPWT